MFKYVRQQTLIDKHGYILTSLQAVISFLQNLDGAALMKG
jgi:hypothetical protein